MFSIEPSKVTIAIYLRVYGDILSPNSIGVKNSLLVLGGGGCYWVPQKLPQIYTVIAYICTGKYIFAVIYDTRSRSCLFFLVCFLTCFLNTHFWAIYK